MTCEARQQLERVIKVIIINLGSNPSCLGGDPASFPSVVGRNQQFSKFECNINKSFEDQDRCIFHGLWSE